jgi:hypothetical protein
MISILVGSEFLQRLCVNRDGTKSVSVGHCWKTELCGRCLCKACAELLTVMHYKFIVCNVFSVCIKVGELGVRYSVICIFLHCAGNI